MNAPRNAATRVLAPACWAMAVGVLTWTRTAEQTEERG